MAFPPPIPTKPADRLETWAEYEHRRQITAMWRQIGDFATSSRLSEFLFASYRGIPLVWDTPLRTLRTLPLPEPEPGEAWRAQRRANDDWFARRVELLAAKEASLGSPLLAAGQIACQFEPLPEQRKITLPEGTRGQTWRIVSDGRFV